MDDVPIGTNSCIGLTFAKWNEGYIPGALKQPISKLNMENIGIPDNSDGTLFRWTTGGDLSEWNSMWGAGTVTKNAAGNILLTNNNSITAAGYQHTTDVGKFIYFRVKMHSDRVGAVLDICSATVDKLFSVPNDKWVIVSARIETASAKPAIFIGPWTNSNDTLEISDAYIGDGSFSAGLQNDAGSGNYINVKGVTPSPYSRGFVFNGINSYCDVPNSLAGKSVGSIRIKVNELSADAWSDVWSFNNEDTSTAFRLERAGSHGSYYVYGIGPGINGICVSQTGFSVRDIVLTCDGTTFKVYVDGKFFASNPYSGTPFPSTSYITLGRKTSSSGYFKGALSDFALFDYALSRVEVARLASNQDEVLLRSITYHDTYADSNKTSSLLADSLSNITKHQHWALLSYIRNGINDRLKSQMLSMGFTQYPAYNWTANSNIPYVAVGKGQRCLKEDLRTEGNDRWFATISMQYEG